MSHVDEGLLHAYLDGALAPGSGANAEIRAHLAACADCRSRLEEARALRDRAAEALLEVSLDGFDVPPFVAVVERSRGGAADRHGRAGAAGPWWSWSLRAAWAASVAAALGAGWLAHGLLDGGVRGDGAGGEWIAGPANAGSTAERDVARRATEAVRPSGGVVARGAPDRASGAAAAARAEVSGTGGRDEASGPAASGRLEGRVPARSEERVPARPDRLAPPDPGPLLAAVPGVERESRVELPDPMLPPPGPLVTMDGRFWHEARELAGMQLADALAAYAADGPAARDVPEVPGATGLADAALRGNPNARPATARDVAEPQRAPGPRRVGPGLARPSGVRGVGRPSTDRTGGVAPDRSSRGGRSLLDLFRRRPDPELRDTAWIRITVSEAATWLGEPPLGVTSLPAPETFTLAADPSGPVRSVQPLGGGGALVLVQWPAGSHAEPPTGAEPPPGAVLRAGEVWERMERMGADPDRAVRVLYAGTGPDGVAIVQLETRGTGARLRMAAPLPVDSLLDFVARLGPIGH